MSLYMSESLVGNVNLNQLKESLIFLKIQENNFKIRELYVSNNKVEIETIVSDANAYQLLSKEFKIVDMELSWSLNKKLMQYNVVSLKHFLENDMDSYILKLQLIFEV